jgi:hypothetical protein
VFLQLSAGGTAHIVDNKWLVTTATVGNQQRLYAISSHQAPSSSTSSGDEDASVTTVPGVAGHFLTSSDFGLGDGGDDGDGVKVLLTVPIDNNVSGERERESWTLME